eukprot:TRINITY_DN19023_c1_g1_i17.p1 TRINITY_DN19023_c1_g1~~TRINITY_DN19023_c1_g1_i17.p1  ORF type:complete len:4010 (-),score=873.77 TRINITY_DN19023_c1_g1_i17:154-12183(-)
MLRYAMASITCQDDACTNNEVTCSGYSCGAGLMEKAGMSSITCAADTCTDGECCNQVCDMTADNLCYTLYSGQSAPDAAELACQALGGHLAKTETAEQYSAVESIARSVPKGNCIRFGAVKVSSKWVWRDGSTQLFSDVIENNGGDETCSCWWKDDSLIYDAPCQSFSQGDFYICAKQTTTTTTVVYDSEPSSSSDDAEASVSCPAGTWVQKCESVPADAGDGVRVAPDGTGCTAISSGGAIRARATCAVDQTVAYVSSDLYFDNQRLFTMCAMGEVPLSCSCETMWQASKVCGGDTEFAPSGDSCSKRIPVSQGRRRGVETGAGAKIWAICLQTTTTTSTLTLPQTTTITTMTITVTTTSSTATITTTTTTAAPVVPQCSFSKFGINFCFDWCNTTGLFSDCGTHTLPGSDGNNTDNENYTCSCRGCNGCPEAASTAEYVGCFNNSGNDRSDKWMSHLSPAECALFATDYFGLEFPQSTGFVGTAQCRMLGGLPQMEQVADSKCENESHDGKRLGDDSMLAVYSKAALPGYSLLGTGHCDVGFYDGGPATVDAASAQSCADKCTSEPQCKFFAVRVGISCLRFDDSAGPCDRSIADEHVTYSKEAIPMGFSKMGSGACKEGYYDGINDNANSVNESACAEKCAAETSCQFFAVELGAACARYNDSAGSCVLDEDPNLTTYRREALPTMTEVTGFEAGEANTWTITKGEENWYTIRAYWRTSAVVYLSALQDGTVAFANQDDGSGRQRWLVEEDLLTGWHHIKVLAGVAGNASFLSSTPGSSALELRPQDDGSGHQRWVISNLNEASVHPGFFWSEAGPTSCRSCDPGRFSSQERLGKVAGTMPIYSRTSTLSSFPVEIGTGVSLGFYQASFSIVLSVRRALDADDFSEQPLLGSLTTQHREGLYAMVRFGFYHFGFYQEDCASSVYSQKGVWDKVVFVYNRTLKVQSIFVNGTLAASCDNREDYIGTSAIYIGSSVASRPSARRLSANLMEGDMKFFSVYPRALTDSEVASLEDPDSNNLGSACGVGYYGNTAGGASSFQASCSPCLPGRASAEEVAASSASCQACAPGTYQALEGQSGCIKCPEGTYSAASAAASNTTCQACPAGTWNDVTGATECQGCPAGTWSATQGATNMFVCINCGMGRWSDSVGAASVATCEGCAPGKWSQSLGATAISTCQQCEAGRWSDAVAETKCNDCGRGRWSDTLGAADVSTCEACGAGRWSTTLGAADNSFCLPCAAGRWSDRLGETECSDCWAGTWNSQLGSADNSSCQNCPAGRLGVTLAATDLGFCLNCSAGTWSSTPGATVCIDCHPGTWSDSLGADNIQTCEACGAGRYSDAVAAISVATCQDCLPGSWSAAGYTNCTLCTPGRSSSVTGAAASSFCQPCSAGRFHDLIGSSTLTDCKACGLFTYSTPGSTKCSSCLAGTVPKSDRSGCSTCQPGKWAAANASYYTCRGCSAGKFGEMLGGISEAAACQDCPKGRITSMRGLSECSDCTAGRYSGAAGLSTCVECKKGQFQESDGSSACMDCEAGTFSASMGSSLKSDCAACDAGRFSGAGAGTCELCQIGKFQDSTASSECRDCEAGRYAALPGSSLSSACLPCEPGSTSDAGASICNLCEPGSHAASSGASTCSPCQGSLHQVKGAISCCPAAGESWPSDEGTTLSMPPGKSRTEVHLIDNCDQDIDGEDIDVLEEKALRSKKEPKKVAGSSGGLTFATIRPAGVHSCMKLDCGSTANKCSYIAPEDDDFMPGLFLTAVAEIPVRPSVGSSVLMAQCNNTVEIRFAAFGCEPGTIIMFSLTHLSVIGFTLLLAIAIELGLRRRVDVFVEMTLSISQQGESTGNPGLAALPGIRELHRDVKVALQVSEDDLPINRFRAWRVNKEQDGKDQPHAVQLEFQVAAAAGADPTQRSRFSAWGNSLEGVENIRKRLKHLKWQATDVWGKSSKVSTQQPAVVMEIGRLPGADLVDSLEACAYKMIALCCFCCPGSGLDTDEGTTAMKLQASRAMLAAMMTKKAAAIIALQALLTLGMVFALPLLAWLSMTCESGYPTIVHLLWIVYCLGSNGVSSFFIYRQAKQINPSAVKAFSLRFRLPLLLRYGFTVVSITDLYQDATFPVIAGRCGFDLWFVSAWLVFLGVVVMQVLVQLLLVIDSWRSYSKARTPEERERHHIEGIFLALRAMDNHMLVYACRPAVEERLGGSSCWTMKMVEARVAFARFIFEDAEQCALQGIFLVFFESASLRDKIWISLSTATSVALSFTLAVQTLAEVRDWLWHRLLATLAMGKSWKVRLGVLMVLVALYRLASAFPWLGSCTPAGNHDDSTLDRLFLQSDTPLPDNVILELCITSGTAVGMSLLITCFGLWIYRDALGIRRQKHAGPSLADYNFEERLEGDIRPRLQGEQDDAWLDQLRKLKGETKGEMDETLRAIDEQAYYLSRGIFSEGLHGADAKTQFSSANTELTHQLDKVAIEVSGDARQTLEEVRKTLKDGLLPAEVRHNALALLSDRKFRKADLLSKADMISTATSNKAKLRLVPANRLKELRSLQKCDSDNPIALDCAQAVASVGDSKKIVLVYFSHTWHSRRHPDNQANSKLHGLVEFARWFQEQAESQGMKIELFFWIDYCCLTLDEAAAALPAIPLFIAACTEILAWRTADFDRGGWPLMERLLAYCFCPGGLTPYAIDAASYGQEEVEEEEDENEEEDFETMMEPSRRALKSGKMSGASVVPQFMAVRRQRRLLDPRTAAAGRAGGGIGGKRGRQRRIEQLVDMALSVSALEIFADRQPVDFGLTAVVELWLGAHQVLKPVSAAEMMSSATVRFSALTPILAWRSERSEMDLPSGKWLRAELSSTDSDTATAPEWHLSVQTQATAKAAADSLQAQHDDSIVVVTPEVLDVPVLAPEDVQALFNEVDSLMEAQSLSAVLGRDMPEEKVKRLEEATVELGTTLRTVIIQAMETGTEEAIQAALRWAAVADIPEAPDAVRMLCELQLVRCSAGDSIQDLEMALREAKRQGCHELAEYAEAKQALTKKKVDRLKKDVREAIHAPTINLESVIAAIAAALKRDWADCVEEGRDVLRKVIDEAKAKAGFNTIAEVWQLSRAQSMGTIENYAADAWGEKVQSGRTEQNNELLMQLCSAALKQGGGPTPLYEEAHDALRGHIESLEKKWDKEGRANAAKAMASLGEMAKQYQLSSARDLVQETTKRCQEREQQEKNQITIKLSNNPDDAEIIFSCTKTAMLWNWEDTLGLARSRVQQLVRQATSSGGLEAVRMLAKMQRAAGSNDVMSMAKPYIDSAWDEVVNKEVSKKDPVSMLHTAHTAEELEVADHVVARLRDAMKAQLAELTKSDSFVEQIKRFEHAAQSLGDTEAIELATEGFAEIQERENKRKQQASDELATLAAMTFGDGIAAACIRFMSDASKKGWGELASKAGSIVDDTLNDAEKAVRGQEDDQGLNGFSELVNAWDQAAKVNQTERKENIKRMLFDTAEHAGKPDVRDGAKLARLLKWSQLQEHSTMKRLNFESHVTNQLHNFMQLWSENGPDASPIDPAAMISELRIDPRLQAKVEMFTRIDELKKDVEATKDASKACELLVLSEGAQYAAVIRLGEKFVLRSLDAAKDAGDEMQMGVLRDQTSGSVQEQAANLCELHTSLRTRLLGVDIDWSWVCEKCAEAQKLGCSTLAREAREKLRKHVQDLSSAGVAIKESELMKLYKSACDASLDDIAEHIVETLGSAMPKEWAWTKLSVKKEVLVDDALIARIQQMLNETFQCWGSIPVTRDRRNPMVRELQVEEVIHIANPENWLGYSRKREEIRKKLATLDPAERDLDWDIKSQRVSLKGVKLHPVEPIDKSINEAWMWHGTGKDAATGITDTDFDLSRAGSAVGTMFGRGLYFAESCMKSDEYTKLDERGWCPLILSRVTCGRMYYCDAKRPFDITDELEAACHRTTGEYHCVLGDREKVRRTFREFIVFDNDQVYPEYIVWYSRKDPVLWMPGCDKCRQACRHGGPYDGHPHH